MTIKTKIINQFQAKTEDGKIYTIVVLRDYIVGYNPKNPDAEYPGKTEYRTDDNYHVDPINYYKFRIVETDDIVRRIEKD